MSAAYRAVGWNRTKRRYDTALGGAVLLYVVAFAVIALWWSPAITIETLLIRAIGTAAFGLLHVVLSVGPLCRLDRRFLPLLYNRRHLGVTMCLLALVHGAFSIVQFHALGNEHPIVSLLTTSAGASPATFPFQPLGAAALTVLLLMAATSHDFWLRALTPPVWKALHMSVYFAYVAIVMHVALGLLQSERDWRLSGALVAGAAWLIGLHVVAAWRERTLDAPLDRGRPRADAHEATVTSRDRDMWVDVCDVDEIPESRAKVISVAGERVAVFRYQGLISALSNVCQHQNGPLGEGRIRNGCVVCPWHGYEYLPHSGASPAPFTEKVPTFRVKVVARRVWLDPRPLPPGTPLEPARIDDAESHARAPVAQLESRAGVNILEFDHAAR